MDNTDITVDFAACLARLEAFEARLNILEAAHAAKKAPKTTSTTSTTDKRSKAADIIQNPATNPFTATSVEGRIWGYIGASTDISRGDLTKLIEEKGLTKRPSAIMSYDYIVALRKKASSPVATTPALAPVVDLPANTSPASTDGKPAPVVILPAAPASPAPTTTVVRKSNKTKRANAAK